jgi:hypothetical protein
MKCSVHPEVEAVGVCVNCGKGVCTECAVSLDNKSYCKACIAVGIKPQTGSTNGLSIASMVLGILSIPAAFCYGCGIPLGIAALVMGLIARKQIKESGGNQPGDGMAIAGIVMGTISGLFLGIAIFMIVILALLGPAIGNVFSTITNAI